ncbi:hypothetical protein [Lactococcus lactis]|uniref:Uncharacterized protein n=1 Tax=Lactococcus lactis TaxID=1358 RepID=A0AAP5P8X2_9LACT|nr:hypothetical protein [Lactococcus lactis]MDT2860752.1 hypothetical protein [Lactococcus lactis]MDT2868930.1 hypothetical protein [Lactococcus lactis]MDT2882603.1 hypothetical protein [Lactococcus lactis]MDT2898684.1 hypothetical protein [Lactococcus lactis]MDT2909686.1 hypothetical protein [Lactococcus lactis]
MENNFFKILSGIFGVALLIAVVALFATSISANMKLNEKNTSISQLSAENQKIKKQNEEAQKAGQGKVDEQIEKSTKGILNAFLVYDTKHVTVKEQRDEAGKYMTEEALEQNIKKVAKDYKASVSSVSKIKGSPDIYIQPTKDNLQKVLVVVDQEMVIDNYPTEASWQYVGTFDKKKNIFVDFHVLGELNKLDTKNN